MDLMTFGKHRGDPACDVPLDYLVWAMESMAKPPACVLDELRRRAGRYGSRDAVPAQAALSGFGVRGHRKASRKVTRSRARAIRQSAGEFIGRDFGASRSQWIASGGDPGSCPWE
jgi:hypothetical protein